MRIIQYKDEAGSGGPVVVGTDSQTLSLVGSTLSITGGNSVNLPAFDSQMLSMQGTSLSISGGNTVTIPNVDSQTLTLVGSNLSISGGNSVTLPASTAVSTQTPNGLVVVAFGGIQTSQLNNPSSTRALKVLVMAEYGVDYPVGSGYTDTHFYFNLNTTAPANPTTQWAQYHDAHSYSSNRGSAVNLTRIIDVPPGGSAYFSTQAIQEGETAVALFYAHTILGITI